ncbi:hypothetical protein SAMN06265360_112152 [Haloechinothrix alba]|uniref:Uncharacterized protein n=1 Tax=Haloechinothrix alba TaxID=664784 RepID=A0A238XXD4_9PSEU|nr:hypothetical protein [Haloechinothrix alba]SNR63350.1 hypothetical protein SAMN06265360_112152 [Haloechinothrix alba]
MNQHVLEDVSSSATAFSFASLDASLTAPPTFISTGIDRSLTVTARGDHIPARYRRAMHAFRFVQYWRLGFLDPGQVDLDVYAEELRGHIPHREYHSLVLDRRTGRAVAYVYLVLPDAAGTGDSFTLEQEYDVTVGTTIGYGLPRSHVWEAKRQVRRVGMPWSNLARNAPWWAMLGLSHVATDLHERGELVGFVADGDPAGSPSTFELLGFTVTRSDEKPKPANVDGRYGPMWLQETTPVPYIATVSPHQVGHLRKVEEFLQRNRDGSVRKQLSRWGWS